MRDLRERYRYILRSDYLANKFIVFRLKDSMFLPSFDYLGISANKPMSQAKLVAKHLSSRDVLSKMEQV